MQPEKYQSEIETPIGKHKVVFKTLLTGAEREQVDNAEMRYVDTKDGKEATVKDMQKLVTAGKHELLKVSVISIDGDLTDCFARLHKMYSPDYNAVYEAVIEAQKKTETLTA